MEAPETINLRLNGLHNAVSSGISSGPLISIIFTRKGFTKRNPTLCLEIGTSSSAPRHTWVQEETV